MSPILATAYAICQLHASAEKHEFLPEYRVCEKVEQLHQQEEYLDEYNKYAEAARLERDARIAADSDYQKNIAIINKAVRGE